MRQFTFDEISKICESIPGSIIRFYYSGIPIDFSKCVKLPKSLDVTTIEFDSVAFQWSIQLSKMPKMTVNMSQIIKVCKLNFTETCSTCPFKIELEDSSTKCLFESKPCTWQKLAKECCNIDLDV